MSELTPEIPTEAEYPGFISKAAHAVGEGIVGGVKGAAIGMLTGGALGAGAEYLASAENLTDAAVNYVTSGIAQPATAETIAKTTESGIAQIDTILANMAESTQDIPDAEAKAELLDSLKAAYAAIKEGALSSSEVTAAQGLVRQVQDKGLLDAVKANTLVDALRDIDPRIVQDSLAQAQSRLGGAASVTHEINDAADTLGLGSERYNIATNGRLAYESLQTLRQSESLSAADLQEGLKAVGGNVKAMVKPMVDKTIGKAVDKLTETGAAAGAAVGATIGASSGLVNGAGEALMARKEPTWVERLAAERGAMVISTADMQHGFGRG